MRRIVLVIAVPLLLGGCASVEYYWQGIAGQMELLARARPVADVEATTADPELRARLQRAQAIRRFASAELGLPDNGSYTRYADLGRSFVVWNVFAAPELALEPRRWCFPVAGCVSYRGYFAEADARAEAARLAAEGEDVHVGGVPAYSTLGWFDEPLLSSFIGYREPDLARLIFHELAHQVVYLPGDTGFNESFATAVEQAGLARWLAAQAGRPDATELAAQVARGDQLRRDFRGLIVRTRARLEAIYTGADDLMTKREAKAAALATMRTEYEQLKRTWGGVPAYDRWFAAGANNAGIAAVGLYADRVPQFQALLAAEAGDLPRFYARVRELAALPRAERDLVLAQPARTAAHDGR